tara:strand:- start:182 stop:742 length:561 start_codon:yes stop_codon:yes gene_type:complete
LARALVVYAHPRHQTSRACRRLLDAIRDLEEVTLCDLYEEYPDFHINIGKEQQRLREHQLVVFLFPLYWYSAPSLLKEWQDRVLNFALDDVPGRAGEEHDPLVGRMLWVVTSAGASFTSFSEEGGNRHPLDAYLLPYEQTARVCGMAWQKPFTVCQARRKPQSVLEQQAHSFRSILLEKLQELSHA